MFRALMIIAQAFANAFGNVLWIGLMVGIIDYICAVFLTRMVGHKADDWGEKADMIHHWFGTIARSMYLAGCPLACSHALVPSRPSVLLLSNSGKFEISIAYFKV